MNLLELCDPLFQYICRFNRSARKGAILDLGSVRADIKAMLADLRARANTTPGIAGQFDKIELVLLFFVDFSVKYSGLRNVSDWSELAVNAVNSRARSGFFELLDETLADRSEAAAERLLIFYTAWAWVSPVVHRAAGVFAEEDDGVRRQAAELHLAGPAVAHLPRCV